MSEKVEIRVGCIALVQGFYCRVTHVGERDGNGARMVDAVRPDGVNVTFNSAPWRDPHPHEVQMPAGTNAN